jgi:plasmid segregation protein ParM
MQTSNFFRETSVTDYLATMNDLHFDGKLTVPIIAIDNGFAQYNAAMLVLSNENGSVVPEIKEIVMPAIAARGQQLNSTMGGTTGLYGTVDTDEQYSVNPYVLNPVDTRNEEYPTSSLNLCLTHSILNLFGLEGQDCAIATGLPLEEFMDGEEGLNNVLIDKIVKNLKRKVYIRKKGNMSANVAFVGVYPEAIAGMVDYMVDEFGHPKSDIDPSLTRMAIDIGGNTTDLAIILPGAVIGAKLTLKLGVKHVKDKLRQLLIKRFDHDPDDSILSDALIKGTVSWFGGEDEDVSLEVEAAVSSVMNPIMAQIDSFRKNFPSMREIVGFGGGVALMESVIRERYPNITIMDNPDGANARGILKAALNFDFDIIMAGVLDHLKLSES